MHSQCKECTRPARGVAVAAAHHGCISRDVVRWYEGEVSCCGTHREGLQVIALPSTHVTAQSGTPRCVISQPAGVTGGGQRWSRPQPELECSLHPAWRPLWGARQVFVPSGVTGCCWGPWWQRYVGWKHQPLAATLVTAGGLLVCEARHTAGVFKAHVGHAGVFTVTAGSPTRTVSCRVVRRHTTCCVCEATGDRPVGRGGCRDAGVVGCGACCVHHR